MECFLHGTLTRSHPHAQLRENRLFDYDLRVEGEVTERATAALSEDVDTARVRFVQGDACRLPAALGTFDAVLVAGLLDAVPDPTALLKQVRGGRREGRGVYVGRPPSPRGNDLAPRVQRTSAACFVGASLGARHGHGLVRQVQQSDVLVLSSRVCHCSSPERGGASALHHISPS